MLLSAPDWQEYQLLDSGNGMRLERYGAYILSRPDPQALWKPYLPKDKWEASDAVFEQSNHKGERGRWVLKTKVPDKWLMRYRDVSFFAKLTPFKHTGVFPEQSVQWEWVENKLKIKSEKLKIKNEKVSILNLFAYTGIASLVCANSGAKVTHVDASRPTIEWARENQQVSHLEDMPIRWILDDAIKFTRREIKRGVRYDGIIMDPPVYGHGPDGKAWDFTKHFPELLDVCMQVLSDAPFFILINAYAVSASHLLLRNMLEDRFGSGKVESGELVLQEQYRGRMLSTGIFGRWSND